GKVENQFCCRYTSARRRDLERSTLAYRKEASRLRASMSCSDEASASRRAQASRFNVYRSMEVFSTVMCDLRVERASGRRRFRTSTHKGPKGSHICNSWSG